MGGPILSHFTPLILNQELKICFFLWQIGVCMAANKKLYFAIFRKKNQEELVFLVCVCVCVVGIHV